MRINQLARLTIFLLTALSARAYFYRLKSSNEMQVKKMMMVK